MNTTQPHIDEILRAFFERELEGSRGPITRQRITRVYQRLLVCLETDAESILVGDDRVLLAAERELEPDGAFVRTMHADDLLFGLESFLREPWLDPMKQERQDQRVQLRLTSGLIRMLLLARLIDRYRYACPLAELQARIATLSRPLYPRRMQQIIPGVEPWR
ncbi:hypothetical protein [Cryobacterium zhongshanensis]|uniref:Uncharacterized protein n=1 Tax=Cryobacterium zhongshanensis TaxID=2928153 RepID=A0AA41QYA7_9MICO|nr:hypothetical protein [Cryobacterium zhongshanensis]MCI4659133.1 hypothetical protein [Cryobacterium zhongshanensis]